MTLSTQEYEDFFRHAPGLLCIVDADGGVRAVSAACEELLDLPSGSGGSLFELTHADDAEPLRGSLTQAGAGPASLRELRLRCKGGAYRGFRWSVRAQPGGGALFGILTEQETGSLEERRFRFLVEASADFIGIGELSGRTVYFNPSGCKMLGYTLEEAQQHDVMHYVSPHLHAKYQEDYIPTVMREGKWIGESELMHKDGTLVPVLQSIVIVPDENGRPEALATIAHDITRQKRLEAALRQAIEELSTPIIQVWEGVLALPIMGVVDNSRAAQMMHTLLEAIQSKRCRIAVLDVTGVRTLDTATIDHLFRMIRAAALLGSRCVISGMSPAMAQTVAGIDLDMSELQAFRSLEEALRFAMQAIAGR